VDQDNWWCTWCENDNCANTPTGESVWFNDVHSNLLDTDNDCVSIR